MAARVLVVDDHPAIALALKLFFKRDGRFEVAGDAKTAADGLRLLDGGYAAVLLDLHLPDMEGTALVTAFRDRAGGTPLILYSAADDTAEVEAARPLVDAVVLKSRLPDVLTALERLTAPSGAS